MLYKTTEKKDKHKLKSCTQNKKKKTSTIAVDPQHLKVEVVDSDFSNCSHVINRTCQYLMLIM